MKENEFNLNSATKYKDGTPMMSEPKSNHMNSKCETCMWMRHSPMGHICARGFTLEVMFDCDCKAYNAPRDSNQVELEERIEDLETQLGWYEEELDNLRNFCSRVDQLLNHFHEFSTDCKLDFVSPYQHTRDNFCGNCCHCSHVAPDVTYRCELSGEVVDPDDSSCTMFEPPF